MPIDNFLFLQCISRSLIRTAMHVGPQCMFQYGSGIVQILGTPTYMYLGPD